MAESIIKKLSPEDIINEIWNDVLREYVISQNDILIFSQLDSNEKVGLRQGPPVGQNQVLSTVDVKAKDALEQTKKVVERKLRVLQCLEQLRENMKNWKP